MATWRMSTIEATYPNITSIAQSKNTGQYMLAIASATTGSDVKGRIFKSDDYGGTWTLLQDLFTNNSIDSSHLNYEALETGLNDPENARSHSCVFHACAVSDDGKYQMFGQKVGFARGMWYSTNYGKQTIGGPADDNWKYMKHGSPMNDGFSYANGPVNMRYSQGAYPAATTVNLVYTHFTGLTPANGFYYYLGVINGNYFTTAVPALYDNNFTTLSRDIIYVISGGQLRKHANGGLFFDIINPPGWPISDSEGGGVAVSSDSNIVVAARFVSPNGGLWLSNNGGTAWSQKLVNLDVNAVDMSKDGKYIIAGPRVPSSGTGRFYLSQDFGYSWTNTDLAFTGIIQTLFITNDGKRAVGAGMKSGASYGQGQPSTVGYVSYIGAPAATEQRDAGKTVAELLALSYSISDILNAGYSPNQLIAAGIVPNWNYDTSANKIGQTYVNNFVDLSGDLIVRNDGAVIVGGDASFNNINVASSAKFANDMTLKSRLFIGNDISVNGNLYVGGDLSVNGQFSGNFANNVIPTSAIINYPNSGTNLAITGNVRVTGDTSFNGTTVDLSTNTILRVTGQIAFNDGTIMSTYDDNILSGSFALGNAVFKNSTFAAVTCTGSVSATTKTTSSDYRIKTNVTDLDESYTVDSLVPIQYDNRLSNIHELGLIAHELQAVYPELVKGDKDGAEYQCVNYNGLIGVLVKEVQELKRRKENLCKK